MGELTREERVLLYVRPRTLASFFSSVSVPKGADDCMLWFGAKNAPGYGQRSFYLSGAQLLCLAHRLMYTYAYGAIPAGLQLDHLCRVRACVRPAHLEAVTGRENKLRSPFSVNSINAAKTECDAGHAFDEMNTISTAKGRSCRQCKRASDRRRYHRRRLAAMSS